MPPRVLKFTDRGRAFQAFCDVAAAGVAVERLAGCARRMAADPDFKSRKFPPTLEDWIAKGQWRGWADAPPAEAASAVVACAVPAEIRAAFAAVIRAGEAGSYLDPCGFEPGPPARLIARTGVARDWLERAIRGAPALRALELMVEVRGRS